MKIQTFRSLFQLYFELMKNIQVHREFILSMTLIHWHEINWLQFSDRAFYPSDSDLIDTSSLHISWPSVLTSSSLVQIEIYDFLRSIPMSDMILINIKSIHEEVSTVFIDNQLLSISIPWKTNFSMTSPSNHTPRMGCQSHQSDQSVMISLEYRPVVQLAVWNRRL